MRYLSVSMLAACVAISGMAQAANESANIKFTGEITDLTCKININGQEGDSTVKMETANASEFKKSGDTAKPTPFTISIAGCHSKKYAESFKLSFSAKDFTGSGYLKNVAAGTKATDIAVKLYEVQDIGASPIKHDWSADKKLPAAAGENPEFKFEAQYVSLADTVKAGQVEAALTVNFEYH